MERNPFESDLVEKALRAFVSLVLCCSSAELAAAASPGDRLPTGEDAAGAATSERPRIANAGAAPFPQISLEAEIRSPGSPASSFGGVFNIPRTAQVSSRYGMRKDPLNGDLRMHAGIDLPKPHGSPVMSSGAGRVVFAGRNGGYGNMVEINHGGGMSTRYGHLSSIEVLRSSFVEGGQLIGRVGSTGRSTGSHLHYELRINGRAVDPQSGRLPIEHGREFAALVRWIATDTDGVPQRQQWSAPMRDNLLPQAIIN